MANVPGIRLFKEMSHVQPIHIISCFREQKQKNVLLHQSVYDEVGEYCFEEGEKEAYIFFAWCPKCEGVFKMRRVGFPTLSSWLKYVEQQKQTMEQQKQTVALQSISDSLAKYETFISEVVTANNFIQKISQ